MAKAEEKRSRGRRAVSVNGRRDETEAKTRSTLSEIDSAALPPLEPEMFINRELSWLDFNDRVLFEAEECANPLLERVKFAAIFASNLDEFFMIRVAGIKRKIAAGIGTLGPDGRTPTRADASRPDKDAERRSTDRRQSSPTSCSGACRARDRNRSLRGAAATSSKRPSRWRFERGDLPHSHAAGDRSRAAIPSRLEPQPQSDRCARVCRMGSRFARIKIPATLPRFVPVTRSAPASIAVDREMFTWLEDVVAANLGRLFAGAEVVASYPFHVTRDSDIELDEDEDDDDQVDLMTTMRESIAQRAFGPSCA